MPLRHCARQAMIGILVVALGLTSASFQGQPAGGGNQAELDRLLAPIALYPDALLSQILLCSSSPAKIGALEEWLRSNGSLKGTALQDAATAAGFEASFVALALFPDVVARMAEQMPWTTSIGKAFTADKSSVFASIQRLRTKAQEAGKLKSSAQQSVETKTASNGQQVIVIEPSNPQVVYVPQYNPQTVYVPSTTTVVVQEDDDDAAEAVAAGLIGFTAGVALGAAFDNNYYYGPYGYRGGFYMYDDAWDDWYDHREDAREDLMDHREDIVEERGDRAKNAQEQRTERSQNAQNERTERQQNRQTPEAQAQRDQRRSDAQAQAANRDGSVKANAEARGYSRDGSAAAAKERSGTKSDAFSGYSSGKSTRASSQRGQKSRSSSRSGGGRRR